LLRTDGPLIRHLAETISLDAAGVYNGLPLFVMPDGSEELTSHEENLLDAAPDVLQLPFNDFILDFPFGIEPLLVGLNVKPSISRGRLWVRVRSFASLSDLDRATTVRRDQISVLRTLPDGIFLEGWEEKTAWGGLPPYPDYSAINIGRNCIGDFTTHWHLYPCPECPNGDRPFGVDLGWCNLAHCTHREHQARCTASEMIQSTMCRLVILALIYISEGLGGVATQISWRPGAGREEKTERLKPWVASRRETFVMIDPSRAGDYGHPSMTRPDLPGHHSSPVPHPRRGHWRRLPPDRKTWVRQSWVGSREWQHEGRTYKIVPPSKTI
jgi:hypothetical protein